MKLTNNKHLFGFIVSENLFDCNCFFNRVGISYSIIKHWINRVTQSYGSSFCCAKSGDALFFFMLSKIFTEAYGEQYHCKCCSCVVGNRLSCCKHFRRIKDLAKQEQNWNIDQALTANI